MEKTAEAKGAAFRSIPSVIQSGQKWSMEEAVEKQFLMLSIENSITIEHTDVPHDDDDEKASFFTPFQFHNCEEKELGFFPSRNEFLFA